MTHLFSALHNREFRRYWAAQMLSQSGAWMQTTAQSWLVYRLTGSAPPSRVRGITGSSGRNQGAPRASAGPGRRKTSPLRAAGCIHAPPCGSLCAAP